ncbi:urease accessory protein UreD [Actinoplanes sp. NPDC051859]|uniref:urease accessory protein UreD n=1 Tax=Actinoplanes sp. NPDC051859 TaxID=3363909 RepID=UPI0037B7A433
MRASASIVAEANGTGGTRLTTLRGESPLLLRRTGVRGDATGVVTVHLVGGAAGPLRGDDVALSITVGPGARLAVRSVAAQLALPGRPDLPPSRFVVTASVAAGAALLWAPEPLIAAAGCHHLAVADVSVAEGGFLAWRDDLVCGRHAERPGDVRTAVTIRYAERTLYRHELAVGPGAPGWSGAAVLGDAGALGMLVLACADAAEVPVTRPTGEAAVLPLAGPGLLATAAARDIRDVRAALDPLTVLR